MTKQRKSPAEKKMLAYQKDHVLQVEYPNAFRRFWPRRKAHANQYVRRQTRRQLDTVIPRATAEEREAFPPRPVRRPRVRKWPYSVITLGERIHNRHQLRIERTAWNFFKKPYQADVHQARFSAFLTQLVQEESAVAHHFAEVFADVFDMPELPTPDIPIWNIDTRRAWLGAFFDDEPTWKERLYQWVIAMRRRKSES